MKAVGIAGQEVNGHAYSPVGEPSLDRGPPTDRVRGDGTTGRAPIG